MCRLLAIAVFAGMMGVAGCARQARQPAAAIPAGGEHPVIVHVVGSDRTVTIKSGAEGLVYSMADAGGKVLMADATPAEFEALHPEFYREIRDAIVEAHGQK